MGGAPGTRYQARDLPARINTAVQCSIQAPAPATPDAAADQDAGKVRSAILCPGPTSHPSCISVQHPRARAISRPIPESCTTVQHEVANLSFAGLPLWFMRNCGKAVPQLRRAPGGTRRAITPFEARSRPPGRNSVQWTARPGESTLPPFRISSIWEVHLINFANALSIAGGLVIKTEMNEYFTFDRL
jgi:hypothetical protein